MLIRTLLVHGVHGVHGKVDGLNSVIPFSFLGICAILIKKQYKLIFTFLFASLGTYLESTKQLLTYTSFQKM